MKSANPHQQLATDRYVAHREILSEVKDGLDRNKLVGFVDVGASKGRTAAICEEIGLDFKLCISVAPILHTNDIRRSRAPGEHFAMVFEDLPILSNYAIVFINSLYYLPWESLNKLGEMIKKGCRVYSYHHSFTQAYTRFLFPRKAGEPVDDLGYALLYLKQRTNMRIWESPTPLDTEVFLHMSIVGSMTPYVHPYDPLFLLGRTNIREGILAEVPFRYSDRAHSHASEIVFLPTRVLDNGDALSWNAYQIQSGYKNWQRLAKSLWIRPRWQSYPSFVHSLTCEMDLGEYFMYDLDLTFAVRNKLMRRVNMTDPVLIRRECYTAVDEKYHYLPEFLKFSLIKSTIGFVMDDKHYLPHHFSFVWWRSARWWWEPVLRFLLWLFYAISDIMTYLSFLLYSVFDFLWPGRFWFDDGVHSHGTCFKQHYEDEYRAIMQHPILGDLARHFEPLDCSLPGKIWTFGELRMIHGPGGRLVKVMNFPNCPHNLLAAHYKRTLGDQLPVQPSWLEKFECVASALAYHELLPEPLSMRKWAESMPTGPRRQYIAILDEHGENINSHIGRLIKRFRSSGVPINSFVKSDEIVVEKVDGVNFPRIINPSPLEFRLAEAAACQVISKGLMAYWDGTRAIELGKSKLYPVYGPGRNFADFNVILAEVHYPYAFCSDIKSFDLCAKSDIQRAVRSALLENNARTNPHVYTRTFKNVFSLLCGAVCVFELFKFKDEEFSFKVQNGLLLTGRGATSVLGTLIGLIINIMVVAESRVEEALVMEFGDDNLTLSKFPVRHEIADLVYTKLGFSAEFSVVELDAANSLDVGFVSGALYLQPVYHLALDPRRVLPKLLQGHSQLARDRDFFFQKLQSYNMGAPSSPVVCEIVVNIMAAIGVQAKNVISDKPYLCQLPHYTQEDLETFLIYFDISHREFLDFQLELPFMVRKGLFQHVVLDRIGAKF